MENIKKAKEAIKNTYSPYSNFGVGAALKLKDGSYILGANIENASYGLSNCAERSALFSAYSQGIRREDIESITVIGNTKDPISPCGACRQVMFELMPRDAKVYLTNMEETVKEMTPEELLPYGFDFDE